MTKPGRDGEFRHRRRLGDEWSRTPRDTPAFVDTISGCSIRHAQRISNRVPAQTSTGGTDDVPELLSCGALKASVPLPTAA